MLQWGGGAVLLMTRYWSALLGVCCRVSGGEVCVWHSSGEHEVLPTVSRRSGKQGNGKAFLLK